MTQPIQLSVLLPAYNEAERLRVNLFEVLKTLDEASTEADAHPFELILVDDGSSDDTAGIARGVAQRDARVRVVSYKPNAGKGAALRRGFEVARGNPIAFLERVPAQSHIYNIIYNPFQSHKSTSLTRVFTYLRVGDFGCNHLGDFGCNVTPIAKSSNPMSSCCAVCERCGLLFSIYLRGNAVYTNTRTGWKRKSVILNEVKNLYHPYL